MELDKNYCIREDYKIRNYIKFLDTSNRTDEFQNDVYLYSKDIVIKNNIKKIADVGCGSAYKLFKYFNNYDFIGYDLEPTIKNLKRKYPKKEWIISDFSEKNPKNIDIVICADVVEHIKNPDELIFFIKRMNFDHLVISTPNRDLMHSKLGRPYLGPPNNEHHIREWTYDEFENYIKQFFIIKDHFNVERECGQVIYCVNK